MEDILVLGSALKRPWITEVDIEHALAFTMTSYRRRVMTMRIDEANLSPEERAELEAWGDQMAANAETEAYTTALRPTPPALLELQRAAARRVYLAHEAEKSVREAVAHARAEGLSWSAVGQALGTTGEAARQRYSAA